MGAHPEILVLVSSFWLTDSKTGEMRLTMDQMAAGMISAVKQFGAPLLSGGGAEESSADSSDDAEVPEMISWEAFLRHPKYPGMTMAFRRELWKRVSLLPWPEKAAHDWMVCEYAAEQDGLYRIPDRLVFYRQHGDNTTGTAADRRGSAAAQGRIRLLETMAEATEALCRRETLGTGDKRKKKTAKRTAAMLRHRIRLLKDPFSGTGFLKLLKYDLAHLDCMTAQSLCGDLVCFLRKHV